MQHVRLFMYCANDGDALPLCIDVAIDRQKRIGGRWLLFGLQGETDNQGTWNPFVCRYDNVVDFGTQHENRWGRTDLRAQRIDIGTKVTFWDSDERAFDYVIDEIVSLD